MRPTRASATDKTSHLRLKVILLAAAILIASGWWFSASLKTLPGNNEPQKPFDFSRTVGHWFEIARFENDLEEDFGQATLEVVQTSKTKLQLTLADPKTKTALPFDFEYDADAKIGSAFVPCWGPLVCGYHVIAFDKKSFSWMMVAGHTLDELWLFAREPGLSPETLKKLLVDAKSLGYESDKLIINNRPLENVVKPESEGDTPSMTEVPSYPAAPVPETPANEPPPPLYLPEVPKDIPAVPKDIPAVPRDIPQFGKPATIPDPEIPETPSVDQMSDDSDKSSTDH